MTSMFSGADMRSQYALDISETQSRVATAEEALEKVIAEKKALKTKLVDSMSMLTGYDAIRQSKKRLIPFSELSNPSDFMKLEAALYTMAKKDKEINELRIKHGIASPDDSQLLPGQTTEQLNWHTWMYMQPEGLFSQQSGWGIEAYEAWQTWLNRPRPRVSAK